MAAPDKIRIPYQNFDGARFDCIGRYAGGNQFMAFATGAFPGEERYPDPDSDWRKIKRWVAVLHKFDSEGNHIGSESRLGGFDAEGRQFAGEKAWHRLAQMLREAGLQNAEPCDIHIKPFSVEIDGVVYELVYEHDIEDGVEHEHVMLWPNDIMFHPPWDSGKYST